MKEKKRAKKKERTVSDVDTLRLVPSKQYGETYQVDRHVSMRGACDAPAAVELKDILADYVEPGELDRVCADVLAWHKRYM